MKKALLFAGLAAAALSFVGCNKEADLAPQSKSVEIVLTDAQTRTVNDGMSTIWKQGDQLSVFFAPAGTTTWSANTKFTVQDVSSNRATGTVTLEADANDWYAFYPYQSKLPNPTTVNPAGSDYERSGYTTVGGLIQSQKEDDNTEHLAGKNVPVFGNVKSVPANEMPAIEMKNAASVLRFKVTNAKTEAIHILSVKFFAPEDIVGTYYIDFSGTTPSFVGSGDKYVSDSVTVTNSTPVDLAPDSNSEFYAVIKPFTAASGSKLKIEVEAETVDGSKRGIATKEITLTAATTQFKAGYIKTLTVPFDASFESFSATTLAEAITLEDNTEVELETLTVGAVSTKGYVVTDGTNGLYVYLNSKPAVKVGDQVNVSGKLATYYNVRQLTNSSYTEVASGDGTFEATWTDITANFEQYTNTSSAPVKYQATVVNNDNHTNFKVEGADTYVGTLTNAPSSMFEGVNEGDEVIVYGYFSTINQTNKLVGVYAYKVEVVSAGTPTLSAELVGDTTVPASATSVKVNVGGNVEWTVEAEEGSEDLSFNPATGTGSAEVIVSFPANTSTTDKVYTFFVRTSDPTLVGAGDDEIMISFTQEAAEDTGVTAVTVDFSAQGYENGYEMPATTINGVSFGFSKGTNNNGPKYYTTGTAVRMYGDNSMTVSVEGKTLVSIELIFGSGDGANPITTNVVTYEEPTWTGEASSVTFSIGGTTGQRRIKGVTVKYKDGGSVAPVDPTLTVTPTTLSVAKGETANIEVTTNSDGTKAWTSSDETVATVANGVVTGVKAGTATITLSIAATSVYKAASATVAVTVTDPNPGANTLTMTMDQYVADHACIVSAGQDVTPYTTLQLNGSVRLSTTGASGCGSFWNTSNTNATKQWRLYQKQDGNAIVTVADGCELVSVKFTYGTQNNGTLKDAAGNAVKSGTTVEVSGSNVTYTVGNTGDADNGQVRITAIEVVYTGNGTTFPETPQTEITTTINMPGNKSVYIGETFELSATSNAEGATITYESEDSAIATVSATGVVTGVAEGTVKVYARIAAAPGQYTAAERYCNVTVSKKPEQSANSDLFIFSELGYANAADVTTVTGDNVSLLFAKGENTTNSPKYYDTGAAVRMYPKNTLNISSSKTIKKVEFTCVNSNGINSETTFSTGTCTEGVWTGSAKSIDIVNGGSAQIRIVSLKVTYE